MLFDKLIPIKITDTKQSRNDKEKYKTITLYDPTNDRLVKTYVVSTYGNYTRWKKVLNHNYKTDTAILLGNFRLKELDVVDADSTFTMHTGVSWNDVSDIIENRRCKN